jgi:hypothetical protein
MLITLYGPDSYSKIKKLNDIVESYLKKHGGLSYERFDLSVGGSFVKFRDFIKNISIFDTSKLIVLDNVKETEFPKETKETLKSHTKTKGTTVIVNLSKKPPAAYKFLIEKPAQSQEFPQLKGEKLKKFIQSTSEEYNLKLSEGDTKALIEIFGSDTWGLATEIERVSFAGNYAPDTTTRTNYFTLINSVKFGKTARERILSLETVLSEQRVDAARVFNSIAYRLSSEKEAEKFAKYDVAVKSGKLEYEEVLLSLALGA